MKKLEVIESEHPFVPVSTMLKANTRKVIQDRIILNLRCIYQILHRDEDYESYPNEDEDLIVELADIVKEKFYFTIEVANSVDDVITYEKRTINELHLTLDDSVFIYTDEETDDRFFIYTDEETDKYNLTDLSTDDIFGISEMLDKLYYKLCRG